MIGPALILAAMFKIVPNPTFTFPVKLSRPDSDAPATVTVTFRHKGARALQEWLKAAGTSGDDAAYLDQVIDSWSGVEKDDGAPLPYSVDALRTLLDAFPSSGRELVQAYHSRLSDARAKN